MKICRKQLKMQEMARGATPSKYNVPRSIIHDNTTVKVKEISRPGPLPVLTETEEQQLVQWVIQMAEIGYSQCRHQITMMVKKLLDCTGIGLNISYVYNCENPGSSVDKTSFY